MIFIILLLSLFLIGTAWAFRPGPIIVRECPTCNKQLAQETTMSGNTFNARSWTDGKMEAKMLPDRPWLVKCPQCGAIFWIDEAKKVREDRSPEIENRLLMGSLSPSLPSENEYLTLLSDGKLTKKKELYCRQRAWWAANDSIRKTQETEFRFSAVQENNLETLSQLMNEKDAGQRLIKAEILRELGKFKDCINLLKQPFDDEWHTKISAVIRGLAEAEVRIVTEIKQGKK